MKKRNNLALIIYFVFVGAIAFLIYDYYCSPIEVHYNCVVFSTRMTVSIDKDNNVLCTSDSSLFDPDFNFCRFFEYNRKIEHSQRIKLLKETDEAKRKKVITEIVFNNIDPEKWVPDEE